MPTLLFPGPAAWVPATTPVVVQGTVGATVTVTPDAGSPVSGTINGSGHIRLMVTFTGTGAHSFTVAHVRGDTTTNLSGSVYVPAAGDLYTVAAGASAATINAALAAHQGVILTAGQTYTISEAVTVPSNRYFDGAGSTLALANDSNDYAVRNTNKTVGDSQIVIRNLTINGNGQNQTRRETGPFSNQTTDASGTAWTTDYCGMGMNFSFLNGLWLDGITLNSTNSWAVGYWGSELVLFSNIVISAIPVGSGYNGDGVTGNARRVYGWNISGYTNDDMIAVGTGLSTFQSGRFEGLTPAHNFDVEVVDIQGMTGGYPGGGDYAQGVAETGVGLYPCVGRTIKHVTIANQAGRFNYPFRVSDFWPELGYPLGAVRQFHVVNRTSTGVQGLYRSAPGIGFAFDSSVAGYLATLTGWQREDESVSVSATGGTVSGLAQHSPDATTWTATLAISGASATATATRSSDGLTATATVEPGPAMSLEAAPLDGTATLVPASLSTTAAAGLAGAASLPAPALTARIAASPLASSASVPAPTSALQQAASVGGEATVPGPALTLQQAANIAAEAGFAGGDFAMELEAAPLDGAMSMPEPRQAFHLGILRRAALGSQQRRPWRIYDGRAWTDHRPRQFNGSTF